MWRHAKARYWYRDVIFVDCSCTLKLAQKRSSLMNNNREYRFLLGIHGFACKKHYTELTVWENIIQSGNEMGNAWCYILLNSLVFLAIILQFQDNCSLHQRKLVKLEYQKSNGVDLHMDKMVSVWCLRLCMHTVGCRYNAVQYTMILDASLQWLK